MTTKCDACAKSIYPNDAQWADRGKKWHRQCFKCSECKTKLVLRNAQIVGGVIFCERHKPVDKPTQTADRMDIAESKRAGKLTAEAHDVNTNVRGELAGQGSQEGVDSIGIGGRMQAGKVAQDARSDSANAQIKGQQSGMQKNSQSNFL
eukprot:TRINITY_DN17050_c0_g1_i1.p1 TRINITY_DN17050_c0_g1~~TRINITY_DN17050_c0_g1_i1.p1  ORF type:complete len:160 (+),score=27.82 TRINITY_DN17050_c0_g1_i1:35-481(+)